MHRGLSWRNLERKLFIATTTTARVRGHQHQILKLRQMLSLWGGKTAAAADNYEFLYPPFVKKNETKKWFVWVKS